MELSVSHRYLPPRSRLSRRLVRRDQSGAALLEFVLVAIPFFFILYGLIAFGMMLALKQGVTNAASEAARSAVGSSNATTAAAAAKATVQQRLSWAHSYNVNDSTQFQAVAVNCSASDTQQSCIQVTVTYPYSAHPLVPPAPGLGLFTPDHISSQATVEYK
jgi:Flp pilus assembly protein TadG